MLCYLKKQVLNYMSYLPIFVYYENKHIKTRNKSPYLCLNKNWNKPGLIRAKLLTVVNFEACKRRLEMKGMLFLLCGSLYCFIFISMRISYFMF